MAFRTVSAWFGLVGPVVAVIALVIYGPRLVDRAQANIASVQTLKAVEAGRSPAEAAINVVYFEPGCATAHAVGRAYLLQDAYSAALPLLQQGVSCEENSWAWFDLGQAQFGLGDWPAAAESWHRAEAYAYAAKRFAALVEGGELAPEQSWQLLMTIDPAEATPYIRLANLVVDADPAAAEAWLRQGLAVNDRSVSLYVELARLYEAQESWALAQAEYERALVLEPEDVSVLIRLAENAVRLEQIPAAIEYWQQVAQLSERERGRAYFTIGNLTLADNNARSAIEFYRRAVQEAPKNVTYLLALGQAYEQVGCYREAISTYQQLLRLEINQATRQEAEARWTAVEPLLPSQQSSCAK